MGTSTQHSAAEVRQWVTTEASRKLPFWHLVVAISIAMLPLLFAVGGAKERLDTLILDVAEIKGSQKLQGSRIMELELRIERMGEDIRALKAYDTQLTIWRGFRAEHENAVSLKLWPDSAP